MYQYWNPNPAAAKVGDCTVRAISKAMGQTWEETYIQLALYGLMLSDMPRLTQCGAHTSKIMDLAVI